MSSDLLKETAVSLHLIRKLKRDELDATVSKELWRIEKRIQSLVDEEAARNRTLRDHLLGTIGSIIKWALALVLVHR